MFEGELGWPCRRAGCGVVSSECHLLSRLILRPVMSLGRILNPALPPLPPVPIVSVPSLDKWEDLCPDGLGHECTCSSDCYVFLIPEVRNDTTPPLFPTFKIPSNSPPLVQEEGDVTPKVECMVSNYSPRLNCSSREHWSGSITPPCPLVPPSYPSCAVSQSTQPYRDPPTYPSLFSHPPC